METVNLILNAIVIVMEFSILWIIIDETIKGKKRLNEIKKINESEKENE